MGEEDYVHIYAKSTFPSRLEDGIGMAQKQKMRQSMLAKS